MSTVYESVVSWLTEILQNPANGFTTKNTVIDLEAVPNEALVKNAGIFSSPNDSYTQMIGGQTKCVEFKSFYLRESFNSTKERISNEEYYEKFRNLVKEKNLDGIMPKDGRDWDSIEINGGIYPAQREQDSQSADYLVPLKLVYVQ